MNNQAVVYKNILTEISRDHCFLSVNKSDEFDEFDEFDFKSGLLTVTLKCFFPQLRAVSKTKRKSTRRKCRRGVKNEGGLGRVA